MARIDRRGYQPQIREVKQSVQKVEAAEKGRQDKHDENEATSFKSRLNADLARAGAQDQEGSTLTQEQAEALAGTDTFQNEAGPTGDVQAEVAYVQASKDRPEGTMTASELMAQNKAESENVESLSPQETTEQKEQVEQSEALSLAQELQELGLSDANAWIEGLQSNDPDMVRNVTDRIKRKGAYILRVGEKISSMKKYHEFVSQNQSRFDELK